MPAATGNLEGPSVAFAEEATAAANNDDNNNDSGPVVVDGRRPRPDNLAGGDGTARLVLEPIL